MLVLPAPLSPVSRTKPDPGSISADGVIAEIGEGEAGDGHPPSPKRLMAEGKARLAQTRIGMRTYSAGLLSFSRSSVGAAASARWTSTVSPSISCRMSSR